VFITALLWVTFGSHTSTHADAPVATWNGQSILYDGHQYFANSDATTGNSLGLPQGTHYYTYTQDTTTASVTTEKAFIIYFAPGTDPPSEKTATYASATYTVATQQYSGISNKTTITVTPQGSQSSYSSCTVQGIGWIICPITVFLADGMDTVFKVISSFMVVQPVTVGDSHSSLYIAWNIMRSVANVAFIIVFMIIIYSQLTNVGLSNYGLKKLLPKLIIAAVLVNVSYIICSLAVDLSNVLGFSLQQIFVNIRQNTFNITNDTWSSSTTAWTTLTSVVLSGGAVGIAGVALAGDIVGAVYVLLPLLLGLVLTGLVVLLILAARQAIIVILIIISPLAFVAFLLPNTEQWFKRWREVLMTMLIFFPAFSLVFGGSQLASSIILQNATSVFMVILGLAVQVAPLAITPLVLRFSGDVLGKVAGLVNNPKKGVMDRTKNWAKDRGEMRRQLSMNKTGRPNPFRSIARSMDTGNRRVKERTALYTAINDNNYNKTAGHEKLHEQTYGTELEKERIENRLKTHSLEKATTIGTDLHERTIELENSKMNLESMTQNSNGMLAEYRAGKYTIDNAAIKANSTGRARRDGNVQATADRLNALQANMAAQVIETYVQQQRVVSAQSIQTQNITAAFKNTKEFNATTTMGEELQRRAGGIDIDGDRGAQRALAAALTAQSKAHSEAISNANSILSHYNYSDDLVTNIGLNKGKLPAGLNITSDIREAAIAKIAGGGNANEILRLMRDLEIDASDDNQGIRQTFAETLLANPNKPKFAGSRMLGNAKQGDIEPAGQGRLDKFIVDAVKANKFSSAELLVTQDPDYLAAVLDTMKDPAVRASMPAEKKAKIRQSIALAKEDTQYSGRIGERADTLDRIDAALSADVSSDPNDYPAAPSDVNDLD
jgi:hypothetical protein